MVLFWENHLGLSFFILSLPITPLVSIPHLFLHLNCVKRHIPWKWPLFGAEEMALRLRVQMTRVQFPASILGGLRLPITSALGDPMLSSVWPQDTHLSNYLCHFQRDISPFTLLYITVTPPSISSTLGILQECDIQRCPFLLLTDCQSTFHLLFLRIQVL